MNKKTSANRRRAEWMAWAAFYVNHQMEAGTAASAAQALLERIAVEQQVKLPVILFCWQASNGSLT